MQEDIKAVTELSRPIGDFRWQDVDVLVIDDSSENEFESVDAIVEAIHVNSGLFDYLSNADNIEKVELIETETRYATGGVDYDEYLLVTYTWLNDYDDEGNLILHTEEIRWNRKTHYVGSLTK